MASRWLSRIATYRLPAPLRGLLRRARDEREPLKSLALRHAAIDVLLDNVTKRGHHMFRAIWQWSLAAASLLSGGLTYWLGLPAWPSLMGALALVLAFVGRGLRIWAYPEW